MLLRLVTFTLIVLLPLSAARLKLYLQGGGDLLVSEYEVVDNRVRYYSVERSQWEEIPLELVDLERTRKEAEDLAARREVREQENRVERRAERKARTELHNVPLEDGVYSLAEGEIRPVQQSVVEMNGSKKRTFLKVIAPIPVVAGKTTADIEGAKSSFTVADARPMFYLRLEKISRVGILRLEETKNSRRAQVIQIVPGSDEMFEEQEEIEVFRQQLAPSVYKIWPIEPLPEGEYAVFEYSPGKGDIRVWDFSLRGIKSGHSPPQ